MDEKSILYDKFSPRPVGLFLLMGWNVRTIIVVEQPLNGGAIK